MEILRKILFTVILILSIITGNMISANAESEKGITLNVTYGYKGVAKQGTLLPIVSEVKNTKDEKVNLIIEVLSPNLGEGYNSYKDKLEINSGEEKRIYIPVTIRTEGGNIKVKIYEEDTVVAEKEVFIPEFSYMDNPIVLGILANDIKDFEFLVSGTSKDSARVGNNVSRSIKLAQLYEDILGSNVKNLDGINAMLANNFDFTKIDNKAKENLKIWIENGGILILGGNSINTVPKELLNVSVSKYKDKWIGVNEGEGFNLPLGEITGDGVLEGLRYGKNVLSRRIEKNAGSIIVLGFDVKAKGFKEFEGRNGVLIELFRKDFKRIDKRDFVGSGYPWSVDEALNTMPYEKDFPINNVKYALLVFIIISSYGGYFILKKFDKRGLLWIVIPVTALIVTFSIYNISKESMVADKIQVALNSVFIDEDGNGKAESYYGIGTNYKSSLIVNSKEDVKVELIQNEIFKMKENYKMKIGEEKISNKTIYNGNEVSFEFDNLSALEFKKFKVSGKVGEYRKVDGSIKFNDFSINGKVTNNMDVDTVESYLIFGERLWILGGIKKGQSIDFLNREADFKGNIQEYVDNNAFKVYNLGDSKLENIEKYKNATRLKGLLDIGIRNINDKKPYIVSIVNDYIDYGLTLNSDDIKKFSQSVYVNPIMLNLNEPNGDIVYPPGFISGTIVENMGALSVLEGSGSYQSEGSFIMDYNIQGEYENRFEIKEIKLYDQPIDESIKNNGSGLGDFKCKVEIFNINTKKYEELKFNYGGVTTLSNLKNYVEEGHIKLKYTNTVFEGGKIPLLSVRGKIKNVRS